jgi:uncharacterized membrane protein YqaE (UPF0057 family)
MYWLSSLVALTSLFAPPLGAWLTKKNIMFSFLLAILLDLVCYPLDIGISRNLEPDRLFSVFQTDNDRSHDHISGPSAKAN